MLNPDEHVHDHVRSILCLQQAQGRLVGEGLVGKTEPLEEVLLVLEHFSPFCGDFRDLKDMLGHNGIEVVSRIIPLDRALGDGQKRGHLMKGQAQIAGQVEEGRLGQARIDQVDQVHPAPDAPEEGLSPSQNLYDIGKYHQLTSVPLSDIFLKYNDNCLFCQ